MIHSAILLHYYFQKALFLLVLLLQSEMRDRFASFPSSADFQQYVSWPQLEEALLGIRRDIESINKVPKEVVTSAGVQTDQVT